MVSQQRMASIRQVSEAVQLIRFVFNGHCVPSQNNPRGSSWCVWKQGFLPHNTLLYGFLLEPQKGRSLLFRSHF